MGLKNGAAAVTRFRLTDRVVKRKGPVLGPFGF